MVLFPEPEGAETMRTFPVISLEDFGQAQVFECARGRGARQGFTVFDLLQGNLHGLFQLLVFAGGLADGVVVQQDIRVSTQ